jgi:hypothetical protein
MYIVALHECEVKDLTKEGLLFTCTEASIMQSNISALMPGFIAYARDFMSPKMVVQRSRDT